MPHIQPAPWAKAPKPLKAKTASHLLLNLPPIETSAPEETERPSELALRPSPLSKLKLPPLVPKKSAALAPLKPYKLPDLPSAPSKPKPGLLDSFMGGSKPLTPALPIQSPLSTAAKTTPTGSLALPGEPEAAPPKSAAPPLRSMEDLPEPPAAPAEARAAAQGFISKAAKLSKNLQVGPSLEPNAQAARLVLDEDGPSKSSPAAPPSSPAPASKPSRMIEQLRPAHLGAMAQEPAHPASISAPAPGAAEPKVDLGEWDAYYKNYLQRPPMRLADADEYYKQASLEQKKYLQGLQAERLYWRFVSEPDGSEPRKKAEAEFLGILENASPEQRMSIEMCINLTKAIKSVHILTDPSTSPRLMLETQDIYRQLIAAHPEIRALMDYHLARLALQKAYQPQSTEPSKDYLGFVQRLPESQRDAVYGLRAAFYDRLMNDSTVSAALRAHAASRYARILMARPHIDKRLAQYLRVQKGLDLFWSSQSAETLEDSQARHQEWLHLVSEDDEARAILFYKLASIFYRAGEKESGEPVDELVSPAEPDEKPPAETLARHAQRASRRARPHGSRPPARRYGKSRRRR